MQIFVCHGVRTLFMNKEDFLDWTGLEVSTSTLEAQLLNHCTVLLPCLNKLADVTVNFNYLYTILMDLLALAIHTLSTDTK